MDLNFSQQRKKNLNCSLTEDQSVTVKRRRVKASMWSSQREVGREDPRESQSAPALPSGESGSDPPWPADSSLVLGRI